MPPGDLPTSNEQPPPLPRIVLPKRGACSSVLVVLALVLFLNLMNWKMAFLIGLGLAASGGWLAKREHTWLTAAQTVPGTVVELISSRTGSKGYTYKPRISYTGRDGTVHDFVPSTGSKPAGFSVGESVLLAYDNARPDDKRIVTFGARYGFAAFVVTLGLALALMAALMVVGRLFVPQIYLPGQSTGW